MRLAFVAPETTHHRDTDGNRRFERVIHALADAGHDVTVFCAGWWSTDPDTFDLRGVSYRALTEEPVPASFSARLPAALFRYGPDVIHARPVPAQAVIAASTGGTLARAPLVVEWFGDEGLDREARLTRLVAREPQLVITPSELVRTQVRELGAGKETSRVIPESIDFGMIEEVDVATEVDVVYAHSLDESANVENLLLGLAELRDLDWRATIIGDGPRRGEYEQQAADLRIDDRVTFEGACDRERRLRIYRGAHAFVQTAYREYFATELLWALACGCVGIVEYQVESSAHELIENYERSFRVTSPGELADAIRDAGQFDRRSIDDTWETYDHDVVLDRYLEAYEGLTGRLNFL